MKKAFTLIELLGVIIVLLVISLIAFPLISNKIKEANEKLDEATKQIIFASARNYIEGINQNFYNDRDYCVTIEDLITSDKLDEDLIDDLDHNTFVEVRIDENDISAIITKNCNGVILNNINAPQIAGIANTQTLQWVEFDAKKGVTAIDSKGNDITSKITIEGDVQTTQTGTYTLTYKVSDDEGNTTTRKRKVTVISSIYIDNSGAANPILKGGLIPVTIDEDGTVHKADVTSRWYDYDEQKWANAVILNDNGKVEADGTIKENSIESYFVWIPKYRYQLWRVNGETSTPHEIPIEFNVENTADGENTCATPMTSGNVGTCAKDKWMTHPAFINFDVDGLWVGKFETGYNGATTTADAHVNSNDSTKIIIKPNTYSWCGINVKNIFETAYNYEGTKERILDSHMMKSTEWGAAAILSHSKYGTNKEMGINNYSSCKTGCGAVAGSSSSGTCNPYTSDLGKLASTTGNITGIYDMSGGSWEYMASHLKDNYGSSGFNATNIKGYEKYFDVYINSNNSNVNFAGRILGDLNDEVGSGWYSNRNNFVNTSYQWQLKGGAYYWGSTRHSGIFANNYQNGSVIKSEDMGFRIALAPK